MSDQALQAACIFGGARRPNDWRALSEHGVSGLSFCTRIFYFEDSTDGTEKMGAIVIALRDATRRDPSARWVHLTHDAAAGFGISRCRSHSF